MSKNLQSLFQPHFWGEELYTQMGFFLQTILEDRYIRREMCVESFESSSSVEFENKKFCFLKFIFSSSCRGLKFHVNTGYLFHFCSLLP